MSAPAHIIAAKAQRFADFLEARLGALLDADTIESMKAWGDHDWQRVTDWMNEAERIGPPETVPNESRRAIVAVLRQRLAAADPWIGLPS